MRTLLVGLAVLVLAAPAVASDLRADLIETIDSLRDEDSKRDYRAVLPDQIPGVPKDARLRVEYRLGHYSVSLGRIEFVPGEKAVVVTNLAYGTYILGMRDLAYRGIGFTCSIGSLPPGKYRDLVAKLLLVSRAKLDWREGRVPESRGSSGTVSSGDGELHLRLTAGEETLLGTDESVPAYDPREVFAKRIDDRGRAFLYVMLVLQAMEAVEDREVLAADRESLGRTLSKELAALGEDAPAFRLRLRVASLGALGHAAAIPVLKTLLERKFVGHHARVAIRKIEILNLEDPKKALEALMNHPLSDLREWAEAVMKERYGKNLRTSLLRLFTSEDPTDRLEALSKLARLDPKDLTLARKGLTDPNPRVRVPSAAMVWDAEKKPECTRILLSVAKDSSLATRFEFYARTGAMRELTWHGARGGVGEIREGLAAIALDEQDDVTARGSALLGLAYLGDRKAIPAAMTVFLSQVPDKPVYLHAPPDWVTEDMIERARSLRGYLQTDDVRQDAARTLGILRAKVAVAPLAQVLTDAPKEYEGNFRMWIALSLARIGDPRGREAIETWAARQTDRMRKDQAKAFLSLHSALTGKEPAKALLDHLRDGGSWSDPIWIEIALADLADDERLAELAKADYGERLKEMIANARKRRE